MKKISIALFLLVLFGGGFIGFWLYDRYFKPEAAQYLTYPVKRGDLKELVRVRGQVVSQKEVNLAFPFAGTVEKVYVEEGQEVTSGTQLMSLDTKDFVLELKKLNAQQQQATASIESARSQLLRYQSLRDAEASRLLELQRGARPEQLDIEQSRVASAQSAVANNRLTVIEAIQSAGTIGDDAIRNGADQLMSNPRTSYPVLVFTMADTLLQRDLELQRTQLEPMLTAWQKSLTVLSETTLDTNLALAKTNLTTIKNYLEELSLALNQAVASGATPQNQLDIWRSTLSLVRTNVSTAMTSLANDEAALRNAQASLTIAQNQLKLLQAGNTEEQIQTQEAVVRQAEASIAAQRSAIAQFTAVQDEVEAQRDIVLENIKKSTLYAPGNVRIIKVSVEEDEYFRPGAIAMTVASVGLKLQSDVSEIDIPGIRPSNPVLITFDALPRLEFTGSVTAIEPQEIVKDSDKYYRTDILLNDPSDDVRTGMNADLIIQKSQKSNVLSIPVYAVVDELGKKTVRILRDGKPVSTDIRTGISDGESIEVITGLKEGEQVVIVTD